MLASAADRRYGGRVARTWLSLTVELVEGAGFRFWPRPGRVFAVGRKHTFEQLATAIDVSFGRWDLSHLWQFELPGHIYVAPEHPDWESGESDTVLASSSRLSRLVAGDEFVYEFDLGDSWLHICRVAEGRIDPSEVLGDVPDEPTAYDGWGILPDQYLRRFADDDGDTPEPRDQRNRDLPPFRPWWGRADAPAARRGAAATDSAPAAQAEGAMSRRRRPSRAQAARTRRRTTSRAACARLRYTARTVAASPLADRVAPRRPSCGRFHPVT